MNYRHILIPSLLFSITFASAETPKLETLFKNPPSEAKPHTWWHWLGGNVTKEGITIDLEAMKAIGLGGYQAFYVSINVPQGDVLYDSPHWHEMMRHAIAESKCLSLDFGFHNCAGWSSTGKNAE